MCINNVIVGVAMALFYEEIYYAMNVRGKKIGTIAKEIHIIKDFWWNSIVEALEF